MSVEPHFGQNFMGFCFRGFSVVPANVHHLWLFLFRVFFSSFFFGSLGFSTRFASVIAKSFPLVTFGLLFLLNLVFVGFAAENIAGVIRVVNVKIYYLSALILTAYSSR
jgi:hypothetical protein